MQNSQDNRASHGYSGILINCRCIFKTYAEVNTVYSMIITYFQRYLTLTNWLEALQCTNNELSLSSTLHLNDANVLYRLILGCWNSIAVRVISEDLHFYTRVKDAMIGFFSCTLTFSYG